MSIDGIKVDPKKVEVIRSWKPPCTIKGIQSFLSFCNFYYQFIYNYGVIAKPLIRLTRKNTPFMFNNDYIEAFRELKDWLISSLILYYYNPDLKLMLETDASNRVVAGVLL
jgi:RNase H-like domain found in reverse transcriptase